MSPFVFLVSLALIAAPQLARAQTPTPSPSPSSGPSPTSSALTPLASKNFDWNNLVRFFLSFFFVRRTNFSQQPYQADTDDGVRGRQHGYNRCNSTTENQQSLCQTSILNSIDGA